MLQKFRNKDKDFLGEKVANGTDPKNNTLPYITYTIEIQ